MEENQYYPFGLAMAGISSRAVGKMENKKKFNGYEENKTFDLNWLESFYRTYDPQLGRFWQVDPKAIDFESPYAFAHCNPILFNDPLGDTTELYDMDGNYLNTINNKGALTRTMVDATVYQEMMDSDEYAGADWNDQSLANRFMGSLEKKLTDLEMNTNGDFIAREVGIAISLTGKASDITDGGKVRQKGEGVLSVIANFDNKRTAIIDEFAAISGAGENGLLPNGTYKTGKPIFTGKSPVYMDKKGTFYKIPLILDKSVGIPATNENGRFALQIHPVGYGTSTPNTNGCIGIKNDAATFFNIVNRYIAQGKSLNTTVDITGNANIKTQIKNKLHY